MDYCQFKPENQDMNIESVKELYKSLNLTDLISECLNSLEEIGIKLKSQFNLLNSRKYGQSKFNSFKHLLFTYERKSIRI